MSIKKIFIWEPESIIALDIKNILSKESFDVRIIHSLSKLAPLILQELPDILILCPDLGFGNQPKLIFSIQNLNIPVVIISALNETFLGNVYGQYFKSYKLLMKPFDSSDLIISVNDAIYKNAQEPCKEGAISDYGKRI